MLLSLLDILNLQSNQGGYQREFKRIRVAIKGVKSSLKGFYFLYLKLKSLFLVAKMWGKIVSGLMFRTNPIIQPRGHTPFLIFSYLSLSNLNLQSNQGVYQDICLWAS